MAGILGPALRHDRGMKRQRGLRIFLLFSPFIVVGATAAMKGDTPWMRDARFWLDRRNDSLERVARWKAGFGAVDCGYAVVSNSAPPVDGCVLASFTARRSFRVRYRYSLFASTDTLDYIGAWNPRRGLWSQWLNSRYGGSEIRCLDARLVKHVVLPPDGGGQHTTIGCP